MPESDLIELHIDKDRKLYLFIPQSGQLFELEMGEENEDLIQFEDTKSLGNWNLDYEVEFFDKEPASISRVP